MKKQKIDRSLMTQQEFLRLVNNFYTIKGMNVDINRMSLDSELCNFVSNKEIQETLADRKKVALVFICLNPIYWQYASEMVQGAKNFFLPGHDTDFFFWTDIPQDDDMITHKLKMGFFEAISQRGGRIPDPNILLNGKVQFNTQLLDVPTIVKNTQELIKTPGINIIPTEPIEWPMPTLMRYHLFLQQEEKLKEYDYIYYLDVDMRFAGLVGDEILGDGLTAAPHPGYAVRKEYIPPYEPNPESSSYIQRPGRYINDNGKPRFMPFYAAGGFQGGKTDKFLSAMKEMKEMIDHDMNKLNYIPIWNDETVWNKYLFNNPPSVYLNQSYVYPDSLIKEYYEPLWGGSYPPKIVTITKWFSVSAEGGQHLQQMLKK